MSNVLSDEKKQQVVALGRLGWSLRRIEEESGVRRETASAYLKAAGIAVRGKGGRLLPAKPATLEGVSTDSEPLGSPGRAPSASACEPYRELISEGLARGRNAMALWQELVDDHGFRARYASVKRFVVKLNGQQPTEARVVITTGPGEEAQVDYGEGPMVRDAATGKYRRMRLFVMTLGYSRKSVRLLVWRSSAQVWAELHERAFRRLGGTLRWVLLDYVARHIIVILCPRRLCAADVGGVRFFGGVHLREAHNEPRTRRMITERPWRKEVVHAGALLRPAANRRSHPICLAWPA